MAKNVERLQAREAKELIRREKQLGARSSKFYLIYLFMILSLIYITDEMASTISIPDYPGRRGRRDTPRQGGYAL